MRIKEFQNRVEAQREVIRVVNSAIQLNEQLMGLASKAIGRWVIRNNIDDSNNAVTKIYDIAGQLFFLATKSQEPIDGDYAKVSSEVYKSISELEKMIESFETNGEDLIEKRQWASLER